MGYFTVTGECISGGAGWGITGQIQSIGNIEAADEVAALTVAKRVFPGGWKLLYAEDQGHCHDGGCGCYDRKQTLEEEDRT